MVLILLLVSMATGSYVALSSSEYDYHSGGGGLSPLDSMIQSSLTPRHRDPLQCHVCHSEENSECIDFDKFPHAHHKFQHNCSDNQHTCMVRRFSFTVSNGSMVPSSQKTFAVKRNCSSKCEPGCVVMGERTRIYVCSTCCASGLCNVGSSGSSLRMMMTFFLIPIVMATVMLNKCA